MTNIIIGIDFDNTIVCYHDVFHKVAVERGLIPVTFSKNKEAIRDYLRKIDNEDAWTQMQGQVYGKEMDGAKAFPGVYLFFEKMRSENIKTVIISHKTKYPYLGPKYDLHQAATDWIQNSDLTVEDAFFLQTKEEKIAKIAACGCTHFIDDLPEILLHNAFPVNTRQMLFSPENDAKSMHKNMLVFYHWNQLIDYFVETVNA